MLQITMTYLEEEFYYLMIPNAVPLNVDGLYGSIRHLSLSFTSNSGENIRDLESSIEVEPDVCGSKLEPGTTIGGGGPGRGGRGACRLQSHHSLASTCTTSAPAAATPPLFPPLLLLLRCCTKSALQIAMTQLKEFLYLMIQNTVPLNIDDLYSSIHHLSLSFAFDNSKNIKDLESSVEVEPNVRGSKWEPGTADGGVGPGMGGRGAVVSRATTRRLLLAPHQHQRPPPLLSSFCSASRLLLLLLCINK